MSWKTQKPYTNSQRQNHREYDHPPIENNITITTHQFDKRVWKGRQNSARECRVWRKRRPTRREYELEQSTKGWVRLFRVGLQLPCFSGAFDVYCKMVGRFGSLKMKRMGHWWKLKTSLYGSWEEERVGCEYCSRWRKRSILCDYFMGHSLCELHCTSNRCVVFMLTKTVEYLHAQMFNDTVCFQFQFAF